MRHAKSLMAWAKLCEPPKVPQISEGVFMGNHGTVKRGRGIICAHFVEQPVTQYGFLVRNDASADTRVLKKNSVCLWCVRAQSRIRQDGINVCLGVQSSK
jgi:hypothetical protein